MFLKLISDVHILYGKLMVNTELRTDSLLFFFLNENGGYKAQASYLVLYTILLDYIHFNCTKLYKTL